MLQNLPDPESYDEPSRPSSSNLLKFALAFVGGLAVFALIGLIVWLIIKPDAPATAPADSQNTIATTQPDSRLDERFSVVVFITDNDGKLQSATVVTADPAAARMTATGFPAELSYFNNEFETLEHHLTMNGAEAAHRSLAELFGQPIDYYAALSYDEVEAYLNSLECHLVMNLEKEVSQQPPDGSFSIHLPAGERGLSPKQVANLLRCDNWQGGLRERAQMHAEVVAAYVDQFVVPDRHFPSDVSKLYMTGDTNLTTDRLGTIEPALKELARHNSGEICSVLPTYGSFSGAGNLLKFTPDSAMVDGVKNELRPDDNN